jgi:hypothetical protein
MRSLTKPRGKREFAGDFIRNPVTEIVCAFILEMSKSFIFAFIFQFTGDQLVYTIFQYSFLMIPWIMLGHGALRHTASQNTANIYSGFNDENSPSIQMQKKNLNLFSLLFAAFIIIELLPL